MQAEKIDKEYRVYRILYVITRCVVSLLYRIRVTGRENLPKGAFIVCANHSNWLDPFLIAFALTIKRMLHMMAKAELFQKPFLRWLLSSYGAYPVNRGASDVTAIKTSFKYLKNGEIIGIFPEGTRVSSDYAVNAKSGAVRLAYKAGCPIIPVYIPRQKKLFHKLPIVVGKPYYVGMNEEKPSGEDYTRYSEELMMRIAELKPEG